MAFFGLLMASILLIMALMGMASPSLSLSSHHQLKLLETPTTISAAPALMPSTNPPLSPYTELSPDISPLLPSPGGKVPSPTTTSIPTIPSNPSPPNPDETADVGPGSAVSPSGSLPTSSAVALNFVDSLNFAVFVGVLASWSLVMVFTM